MIRMNNLPKKKLENSTPIPRIGAVDGLDLKILVKLKENQNRPPVNYVSIAEELKVSDWLIRNRIKKLLLNGVIKGYDVIIDPTKIGYDSFFSIGVQVHPSAIEEITKKLAKHPCVYQLVHELSLIHI